MGGDHGHNKMSMPDWRQWKVEGTPMEFTKQRLAARGLKDPWARSQRDVEILRRLRPRCDSVGCAAERLQVGLCSLYRRSGGRVRPVSTQEGGSLMLVPEYNNILYFCSLNVSVISPHCFPYSVYILLHL
uniref:Uncharacterized protein n=1 Tax=Gasterosteus aculeatus aculeatus TaxID=481459 RepID=A0AAQ4NX91_GASAC